MGDSTVVCVRNMPEKELGAHFLKSIARPWDVGQAPKICFAGLLWGLSAQPVCGAPFAANRSDLGSQTELR